MNATAMTPARASLIRLAMTLLAFLVAAKGVLVISEVKKVGLVVGGQWGEGVLRIGGKTADYYRMTAASIGFQAGVQQAKSWVVAFIFGKEGLMGGYSLKGQKLSRFKPE